MPNNYLPGLIQIRPQYTNLGADIPENIMFWEGSESAGYSLAQLQAIQAVFDHYWPLMWNKQADVNVTYLGSIITDWTSDAGLEWSSVGTLTPVAGVESGLGAAQSCCLISWVVPLRWRGGHFRTYLPGVAASALSSESAISASITTAMVTAIATLLTQMLDISGANGGPVAPVAFRFRNQKPDVEPRPTTYPFSSYTVQAQLATQRRRVRKVTRK